MKKSVLSISLLVLTLAGATQALAVCGDVTGDGKKTTADALAVLRSAVGQVVQLQCLSGPTEVRFLNDFNCSSGSSVSTLDFHGYEFSADTGQRSPFQTVDLDVATTMHIELCGGDYDFSGEQILLPGRQYEAFMILVDPDIYPDNLTAWLIFYDLGSSEASMTTNGAGAASQEAGVMVGRRRTD